MVSVSNHASSAFKRRFFTGSLATHAGGSRSSRRNPLTPSHLSMSDLQAGLDHIRRSPRNEGTVELIVRRPRSGERDVLEECELDPAEGVVGDRWGMRALSQPSRWSPSPDTQVNIMNARVIALVAQDKSRWPLAGDQLFVDLDLSAANLPPGTRLAVGSAVLEVTAEPHTGCKKFVERFGADATTFVNSSVGRELHLRGINARVVQRGVVRVGGLVRKVSFTAHPERVEG